MRRLAEILVMYVDEASLSYYLNAACIVGKSLHTKTLELCVIEDPLQILSELCNTAVLSELAGDLGVCLESNPKPEQLREAILKELGFYIPKTPIGINTYRERIARLGTSVHLRHQRTDFIGIGVEACDDVAEGVLKDIVHFYCGALMGPQYEELLWQDKTVWPMRRCRHVHELTFGQKIGLFERLNSYLQENEDLRDRMGKWFERDWILHEKAHIQNNLKLVSPLRNQLAHPEGTDTQTLKDGVREALVLLGELLKDFEDQCIYPPVIVVQGMHKDRYGRITYHCLDDHGHEERVFTESELEVGQEYFLYPFTNPIRVDPIIVLKD